MPELPEVETIKLGLQKRIVGLKILSFQINSPKSFIGDPDLLQGKKVLNVWRRAKVLGIDLSGNLTLLFHLKMSGQLIWVGDMQEEMPNKHTRVIINFSDESKLYFNDQRRFGWVKVIESLQIPNESFFKKLGPEPLEENFSWQILKTNLLKHPKTPIKVAILDQTVVSGVGNIYACEACFLAQIDPRKKVNSLEDKEFKALFKGIVNSLTSGIKYGGSSKTHFVEAEGKKGFFLRFAFVYGKEKSSCKKCGNKIQKIKLGGRGTYFCSICQV